MSGPSRVGGGFADRPKLEYVNGQFYIHSGRARVVFSEQKITVGCTDADPEALRKLLAEYDRWKSGKSEFVYQS